MKTKPVILVQASVKASIEKVWQYWNDSEHIKKWYSASNTWHAPHAINDLKVGGKFITRMESIDGTQGFDFEGTYTFVEKYKAIEYTINGGRKVQINFKDKGDIVFVIESFEAEDVNPVKLQHDGWQAILNNFKFYTENN